MFEQPISLRFFPYTETVRWPTGSLGPHIAREIGANVEPRAFKIPLNPREGFDCSV